MNYFYAIIRVYEDFDEEGHSRIIKTRPYGKYKSKDDAEKEIEKEWELLDSNCDSSTIEFKIVRWKKEYEKREVNY